MSIQSAKPKKDHSINCDIIPSIPKGWKINLHEKQGGFRWNPNKIKLCSFPQQKGGSISSTKAIKDLQELKSLNVNIFDYLLLHTYLVPEYWEGKFVYFAGTIYSCSAGGLWIRCLEKKSEGTVEHSGLIYTPKSKDSLVVCFN